MLTTPRVTPNSRPTHEWNYMTYLLPSQFHSIVRNWSRSVTTTIAYCISIIICVNFVEMITRFAYWLDVTHCYNIPA